jgi:2'-5' RNA ligase
MPHVQTQLTTNLAEATCCTRLETLDGLEYLVVPVVALVPGVLNGELVPATEIVASVQLWNDAPIPIEHPRERGLPISARQPAVLERHMAGRLYNVSIGTAGQLHGEMWLNTAKITAMGHAPLLALLQAGGPVEVSTGYFRDLEDAPGEFRGKAYSGIARNLRPDHLALLTRGPGACSWQDGCGAPRINQAGDVDTTAMVAFFLSPESAQQLAVVPEGWPDGGYVLPASELHITLAYLGETTDSIEPETDLATRLLDVTHSLPLVFAQVSGTGRFTLLSGETGLHPIYASLDSASLATWRTRLLERLGLQWVGGAERDFTPHITLGYVPASAPTPPVMPANLPLVLDSLSLVWGEHRTTFNLQGEALTPDAAVETAVDIDNQQTDGGNHVTEKEAVKTAEDTSPVETTPVAEATTVTTSAPLAEQLATLVTEFGGVAALREALQGLRANVDAERTAVLAELQANTRLAFTAAELAEWSTESLNKMADALRPLDARPTANYSGRSGPRTNATGSDWQVLAAPEVK